VIGPSGWSLAAGGRQLVVCHILTRDVTVLDAATGAIVRTVRLDPSGEAREAVALAALEDALWVALRPRQPSTLPGALRRLDATTLASRGESPSGSDTGSLLALPGRASVLASNFETDTVTEHDASGESRAIHDGARPAGNARVARWPGARARLLLQRDLLPGPRRAIGPRRCRLRSVRRRS
jgi:hypothetical protein